MLPDNLLNLACWVWRNYIKSNSIFFNVIRVVSIKEVFFCGFLDKYFDVTPCFFLSNGVDHQPPSICCGPFHQTLEATVAHQSKRLDPCLAFSFNNSVQIYPLDSLQGRPQTVIGVMELPVRCPKHTRTPPRTHTQKGKEKPLVLFLIRVAASPPPVRVFLLQDLNLALHDVSFVRELLHQILVSVEKHHVCFSQTSFVDTDSVKWRVSISTKFFISIQIILVVPLSHQDVFFFLSLYFLRVLSSRWPSFLGDASEARRLSAKSKHCKAKEVCGGGVLSSVWSHSRISCFGPWVSWVQSALSALITGLICERNQGLTHQFMWPAIFFSIFLWMWESGATMKGPCLGFWPPMKVQIWPCSQIWVRKLARFIFIMW